MWKQKAIFALFYLVLYVDGFINLLSTSKVQSPSFSLVRIIFLRASVKSSEISDCSESQDLAEAVLPSITGSAFTKKTAKMEMLRFAIPALGIYLCNPLLSNIDNAFVGRTAGTTGLAALSPATICTDQMLYMFSFLGRATTGIVSRAYSSSDSSGGTDGGTGGDTLAAREAASAPLTVSIICGIFVSVFYAFFTPNMLSTLNVNPTLRPAASAYIYWRGTVASAALAQSVCLSVMMATRDAITPLKIVGLAALVNILGDASLCVWPMQWGCAGAAAATAFATLFSCGFMLKALANKHILPKPRVPTKHDLNRLLEYTGPLFAITLTRLGGFVAMQRTAMSLGNQALAGYQLCVNLLIFFLLFGEPLSQLSQTKLPGLLDQKDGLSIRATLKSISVFAAITSIAIASITYAAAMFGSGIFSTDKIVQQIAQATAPSLFTAVGTAILAVAVDGANMASRDFKFMLFMGSATFLVQLLLLPYCKSVADILFTFSVRLGAYTVASLYRILSGSGEIGRSLKIVV